MGEKLKAFDDYIVNLFLEIVGAILMVCWRIIKALWLPFKILCVGLLLIVSPFWGAVAVVVWIVSQSYVY